MTSHSGTRGIGKTYHLAVRVYEKYKEGNLIITNFSHTYSHIDCSSLTVDEFHGVLRQVLLFKEMGYEPADLFHGFIHTGIFIAIDEGHLYFSADESARYKSEESQEIIKLLAQARKQDVQIEYTVQDPSKIDKNWRRYTEEYIRYTPVVGLRYWKWVEKHRIGGLPSVWQREMRYYIPLVWEEQHKLDQNNPVFNYSVIKDEQGFSNWSKQSTIIKRRIRRSGWMNPFPYKLYNHNQVVAVKHTQQEAEFANLRTMAWIPHTYKKELFPTFKNLIGKPHWRKDYKMPPRMKQKGLLELPPPVDESLRKNILQQPDQFLESLRAITGKKGHKSLFGKRH
jgi:hypothetical protein